MSYSLHPSWEGVWEIRGNSRWNGDRMVICIKNAECILTDPNTMQTYILTAEPSNSLRAHWDFRSHGKSQRYYIGSLLEKYDFNQIEWSEMRKKRKTDKWIRIHINPSDFLKQCKVRNTKQHRYRNNHNNQSSNRRIIRRKQPQQNGMSSPNINSMPTYRQKQQTQRIANQHGMVLKRNNYSSPQNGDHHKRPNHHFNDPAIMQISNGNSHNQSQRNKKYQTSHTPHKHNTYYAKQYPKHSEEKVIDYDEHSPMYKPISSSLTNVTSDYMQPKHRDTFPIYIGAQNKRLNYSNDAHRALYRESPPRPQHKQSAIPPMNWNLVSSLNLQPRLPDRDRANYKTQEQIHQIEIERATKYSLPRRTALHHDQSHEPRHIRDRKKYAERHRNNQQQQRGPAVLDAYFEKQKNQRERGNKNDKKLRLRQRRRDRNRFYKHLSIAETDKILKETKNFTNKVLYIGTISLSRFNPNVAYISVQGLDRDIRISGFVDRNRAFNGDKVVVSIYPEIEWLSAIAPEIKAFEERMDERERVENLEKTDVDISDADEVNAAILDTLTNEEDIDHNASSSGSSTSDEEDEEAEEEDDDNEDTASVKNAEDADSESKKNDDEEDEIIFFEGSESEKEKSEKRKSKTEKKEQKKEEILFKKIGRKRLEELVDKKSIIAFDYYLFLKDLEAEFKQFKTKWSGMDLMDEDHPRRQYIDQAIEKCDGKTPSEALADFSWPSPSDHPDKIPRGKVIGIYEEREKNKSNIPGFLQPLIYDEHGRIDRKWAIFTPSDKRWPKARFPMRELPKSVRSLFGKFEKEEVEIIQEFENRKHDMRRQGYEFNKIKKMIKKRKNRISEELKLMFFNMSFERKWPNHHFMPFCHLESELGKRGTVDVETKVILARHNITWGLEFDPKIEEFVKDFRIGTEDFVGRRDCRKMRVFTIDPTSARDFDDALSIECLSECDKNGKKLYRIGIHIADVTHFVKPDSVVDVEAKNRATSVYLVDRCLPMLPHHLCQNLCSLNPDVDRLAYSVFVILNEEGHLIQRDAAKDDKYAKSPWFGKTVIRSRARLNYETAHWMLIDKVTGDTPIDSLDECCSISDDVKLSEIVEDTKTFWSIAKQMRERRFAAGSVKFFRPHIRFRLDKEDQSKALKFGPEILLWSNNMIEEMMLLANQLVANQLVMKIKDHALLRMHPSPLQEKGRKLQLICRSQKMDLRYDTPSRLNESLVEMYKKTYDGVPAAKLVNVLLAQSMQRAQYIIVEDRPSEEWRHWALNFPIYTHFTSPIRRYADVLVHRLLSYTVFKENGADDSVHDVALPSIEEMKDQCNVCNDRNSAAHFAELDSQKIHLCLVLIDRPIIVDAHLIDLQNMWFILVVPGLGLDVRCRMEEVQQESKGSIKSIYKQQELPDSKLYIEWKDGTLEQFVLFDKLRIQLGSVLKTPIVLVTKIIEPHKRKYTKAVNANIEENEDGIVESTESTNKSSDVEEEEEEKKLNDDDDEVEDNPVAMTLDSQLKVGTCDYYAAHYD